MVNYGVDNEAERLKDEEVERAGGNGYNKKY
jgi:hypothetical protein